MRNHSRHFGLLVLGAVLVLAGPVRAAETHPVTVNVGEFEGRWEVLSDGQSPSLGNIETEVTVDLQPGEHTLRLGQLGGVSFTVGEDGMITSGNPATAESAGSTLTLKTTPVYLHRHAYSGTYFFVDNRAGSHKDEDYTAWLAPAQHYWLSIGQYGGAAFYLDAEGKVSFDVDQSYKDRVGGDGSEAFVVENGNEIHFNTTTLIIDPGEYVDAWWLVGVNDDDRDVGGYQSITVVPGLRYGLRPSSQQDIFVQLSPDGDVMDTYLLDGEGNRQSAEASVEVVESTNIVRFKTVGLDVDYVGDDPDQTYKIGYGIERQGDVHIELVPGLEYQTNVGRSPAQRFTVLASCKVIPNPVDNPDSGYSLSFSCAEPILDTDEDGIVDDEDNCPVIANTDQSDLDGDGAGDVCDPDVDGDGVVNDQDACEGTSLGGKVGSLGCTASQLIRLRCDGPEAHENRGQYLRCVVFATREAASEDLISKRQKVWFLKLVVHKFAKHVHKHHGHHHKRSRQHHGHHHKRSRGR